MELQVILNDASSKAGIINLKNFIDKNSIEGLQNLEIERKEHQTNQMGAGDILSSIKLIIEASQKPLVELVKCLQKYVNNYRTTITIPTKNGQPIKLEHGRSMSAEELKNIVVAIQQADK